MVSLGSLGTFSVPPVIFRADSNAILAISQGSLDILGSYFSVHPPEPPFDPLLLSPPPPPSAYTPPRLPPLIKETPISIDPPPPPQPPSPLHIRPTRGSRAPAAHLQRVEACK